MNEIYPFPPKTGSLKKHEKFETPDKYASVLIPNLPNREVICGCPPRCGKTLRMEKEINEAKKKGKNILIVDKEQLNKKLLGQNPW